LVGVFSFYFPDARRVAPIRVSVSSSTKRYRQAQAQNAISNGGAFPEKNIRNARL
jgi:hypothetical protein